MQLDGWHKEFTTRYRKHFLSFLPHFLSFHCVQNTKKALEGDTQARRILQSRSVQIRGTQRDFTVSNGEGFVQFSQHWTAYLALCQLLFSGLESWNKHGADLQGNQQSRSLQQMLYLEVCTKYHQSMEERRPACPRKEYRRLLRQRGFDETEVVSPERKENRCRPELLMLSVAVNRWGFFICRSI